MQDPFSVVLQMVTKMRISVPSSIISCSFVQTPAPLGLFGNCEPIFHIHCALALPLYHDSMCGSFMDLRIGYAVWLHAGTCHQITIMIWRTQ